MCVVGDVELEQESQWADGLQQRVRQSSVHGGGSFASQPSQPQSTHSEPSPSCRQSQLAESGRPLRRLKNGNWTAESLRHAIGDIDDGVPIRAASRMHGIPASSLRDHLMGRTVGRHRGRPGVLSFEEEELLVQWISKMQDIGHPVSITQCRLKVAEITQFRATPFQNGVPGQSWVKWFKRRHPELSLRHSQGLEASRARGLCPDSVASFYANLSLLYSTHGYGAH